PARRRPRRRPDEARRGRHPPRQYGPHPRAGHRPHGASRPAMPHWFSYAWYEGCYWLSMATMSMLFSLRTEGRRNVPPGGPALLIANHQSFLDPILVGLCSRRHLTFLARKTLFKNPAFAWVIRNLNGVPIDQEGVGKEGLKTVLGELHKGNAV